MGQDLVPLLQPLLGGAHALGVSGSNRHLFAFAESLAGEDKIVAVLSGVAGPGRVEVGGDLETPPGLTIAFRLDGEPVEVNVRTVDLIERIIDDAVAGVLPPEPVVWTPDGFRYPWADLVSMRPLADPYGLIARWRERIAAYPAALRKAIIARHLPRAASWLDNPKYARNAIHDLTQVLCAVNEHYFPDEMGLPETLVQLSPPVDPVSAERLERQRLSLAELIEATKALAAGDPDEPEAVVQRQLEAYNAHDLEAFLATYAEDIQLERHNEVSVGLEAMRARYGPIFAAGRCRAVIGGRMRQGEWIVDHETAYGLGPEPISVLVAYRVRGGVIDRVRFMA